MSLRSSKPTVDGGPAAKPEPDIYVGLPFVAVAALITGIIFLVLELQAYDWTAVS